MVTLNSFLYMFGMDLGLLYLALSGSQLNIVTVLFFRFRVGMAAVVISSFAPDVGLVVLEAGFLVLVAFELVDSSFVWLPLASVSLVSDAPVSSVVVITVDS